MRGASGLYVGDTVIINGCRFRVAVSGALIPDEEVLTKRFDASDEEMTAGVRRALLQRGDA